MKNILIMGIGRAGKSTLSNMIKNKYNSYNLIHSDSLKWGMIRVEGKEKYYRTNVNKQKEFEHGEYFQKTLLEFYNSLIEHDIQKYGYILESGQLHPKVVNEMINFHDTFVICLGLGDLSKEEMVEQCIKYDTSDSWTYGLEKEYLLKHAEDWDNFNKILKLECPKYNIRYIDTSKNRMTIFNKIVNEISNLQL